MMKYKCNYLAFYSSDFELVSEDSTKFWTGLFETYFLLGDSADGSRDDMLFYVRRGESKRHSIAKVTSCFCFASSL